MEKALEETVSYVVIVTKSIVKTALFFCVYNHNARRRMKFIAGHFNTNRRKSFTHMQPACEIPYC